MKLTVTAHIHLSFVTCDTADSHRKPVENEIYSQVYQTLTLAFMTGFQTVKPYPLINQMLLANQTSRIIFMTILWYAV